LVTPITHPSASNFFGYRPQLCTFQEEKTKVAREKINRRISTGVFGGGVARRRISKKIARERISSRSSDGLFGGRGEL
jgi:hypothetical protein